MLISGEDKCFAISDLGFIIIAGAAAVAIAFRARSFRALCFGEAQAPGSATALVDNEFFLVFVCFSLGLEGGEFVPATFGGD